MTQNCRNSSSHFFQQSSQKGSFSGGSKNIFYNLASGSINLNAASPLAYQSLDQPLGQVEQHLAYLWVFVQKLKEGLSKSYYSYAELAFLVQLEVVCIAEQVLNQCLLFAGSEVVLPNGESVQLREDERMSLLLIDDSVWKCQILKNDCSFVSLQVKRQDPAQTVPQHHLFDPKSHPDGSTFSDIKHLVHFVDAQIIESYQFFRVQLLQEIRRPLTLDIQFNQTPKLRHIVKRGVVSGQNNTKNAARINMPVEKSGLIAARPHSHNRAIIKPRIYLPCVANRNILGVSQSFIGDESCVLEESWVDMLKEGAIKWVAREGWSDVAGVVFVPLAAFVEDPGQQAEDQSQTQFEELGYHFKKKVDRFNKLQLLYFVIFCMLRMLMDFDLKISFLKFYTINQALDGLKTEDWPTTGYCSALKQGKQQTKLPKQFKNIEALLQQDVNRQIFCHISLSLQQILLANKYKANTMIDRSKVQSFYDSEYSFDPPPNINLIVLPPQHLASNVDLPEKYQILMDKPLISRRLANPQTTLAELIPSSSTKVSGVEFGREIWDEAFLAGGKASEIVFEVDLKELLPQHRLGIN